MPRSVYSSTFLILSNRELNEFFLSLAIRFLALGMIGIFIPVYFLYELNISLKFVMYFFIFYAISFSVLSVIAATISSRIGFKHSILLSIPFQITFLLLLLLLENFKIPLALVAFTGALASSFYWISHHADLVSFTMKKRRGREVGITFFIIRVATLAGPFLGGLILTYFNFITLFIIGSFLLLVSTVPLFMSKEFYTPKKFSFKHIFDLKRQKVKDAIAFIAQGAGMGAGKVIWPLFIFSILGAYFSLGLIGTTAAFISSNASLIVGNIADKVGRRNTLRVGSFAASLLWFVRILVKNVLHVYIITLFTFLIDISNVPMDTLSYTKARYSGRPIEYLVFREILLNIGKALSFTFLLIVGSYVASFIFVGALQAFFLLF